MVGRNETLHSVRAGHRGSDGAPDWLGAGRKTLTIDSGPLQWRSMILSLWDPEWPDHSQRRRTNWIAVAMWSSSLVAWGLAAMSFAIAW